MNAVATLQQGQRISPEFLAAHRRARFVRALAELVVERGYEKPTVACIVRRAGTARNTFYENFGSKRDAALGMVANALPSTRERMPLLPEPSALDELAIEAAAVKLLGGDELPGSSIVLAELAALLKRDLPPSADELLATLPPGRHGLDSNFVKANQRQRLLVGFSAVVVEHGWPAVTISGVTRAAHVSRRTFYEHFSGRVEIADALLSDLGAVDVSTGLGGVAVEVVAARLASMPDRAELILQLASEVLDEASVGLAEAA